MASYVHTSIHFPDPKVLDRIRAVAKRRGVSPGSFIREAAEKALERAEREKVQKIQKTPRKAAIAA